MEAVTEPTPLYLPCRTIISTFMFVHEFLSANVTTNTTLPTLSALSMYRTARQSDLWMMQRISTSMSGISHTPWKKFEYAGKLEPSSVRSFWWLRSAIDQQDFDEHEVPQLISLHELVAGLDRVRNGQCCGPPRRYLDGYSVSDDGKPFHTFRQSNAAQQKQERQSDTPNLPTKAVVNLRVLKVNRRENCIYSSTPAVTVTIMSI